MSYDDNGIGNLGYEIQDASYDELIDSGYNPSNDLDYNSTIPETDRGWFLEEEAKAGPEADRGWFIQEEAKAGPEASQQDIQNAYPKGFDNSTSSGIVSGILNTLKSAGSSLLQDPAKLAALLQTMIAVRGLINPSTTKGRPKGYTGPGPNMALQATRGPVNMPTRTAYSGQGAMGNDYGISKVTYAADGGIMDLAKGGHTPRAPRYLDGSTDGMADKINTSIDDVQPAKLSHGEFVIPADVVSHLGNGNSSAGAKVLYQMMERVRKARTGNKKQGKQINPEKFTPGGIAGYAGGGAVAFNTGGATIGEESGLSTWAGPTVVDMVERATALSKTPTPIYGVNADGTSNGAMLTAGASPLQTAGFETAANLQPYNPTTFTNQFNAPAAYTTGQFTNEFQAPAAYTTGTFTNEYKAPTPYTTGQFNTGLGAVKSVAGYMDPYMQSVVNVQSAEAQRQAEIARVQAAGRMAQAGGYGGSRQAIMESEGNRNLQTLLGDIQAKGSQSAYASALAQRLAESEASMNAQKYGEESRQFGYEQRMDAADAMARFGIDTQKAREDSRQFGYGKAMNSAELMARFGLDAKKATEDSRQFGYDQSITAAQEAARYGLEAQKFTEDSRVTSAKYGLDALNAQMKAGEEQRAIEQQSLDAQKAQFNQQAADEYKRLEFQKSMLTGLPISTTNVSADYGSQADLQNQIDQIIAGIKASGI